MHKLAWDTINWKLCRAVCHFLTRTHYIWVVYSGTRLPVCLSLRPYPHNGQRERKTDGGERKHDHKKARKRKLTLNIDSGKLRMRCRCCTRERNVARSHEYIIFFSSSHLLSPSLLFPLLATSSRKDAGSQKQALLPPPHCLYVFCLAFFREDNEVLSSLVDSHRSAPRPLKSRSNVGFVDPSWGVDTHTTNYLVLIYRRSQQLIPMYDTQGKHLRIMKQNTLDRQHHGLDE